MTTIFHNLEIIELCVDNLCDSPGMVRECLISEKLFVSSKRKIVELKSNIRGPYIPGEVAHTILSQIINTQINNLKIVENGGHNADQCCIDVGNRC